MKDNTLFQNPMDVIKRKAAARDFEEFHKKADAISRAQARDWEIARLERLNAQQAKVIEDLMDERDEERNETLLNWLGLGLFALLVLSFGAWVASQVLLVFGLS